MNRDWLPTTVEESAVDEPYATQIGPFGDKIRAETYTPTGVPVLRGVNIAQGRFVDDDYVFISEQAANELRIFECKPDDVLLVHKGTLGQVGIMPSRLRYSRYVMGNSMMRVRCDSRKVLPKFLYYWLCSPEGQHYLFSRVSQVGVPQLQRPLTTLREATFRRPPIGVQRDIVAVLDSLDSKIEANQTSIRTIGQLCRATFRGWFLDFECVKAKQAGASRYAGMPRTAFAAVPTTFADHDGVRLPEGWSPAPLSAFVEQRREQVSPSDLTPGTPYIGLEHMPRRSIALGQWSTADEVTSAKVNFHKGDILFGKLRPYFHKVGIAPVDGVCSTDIIVLTPKRVDWTAWVLMLASSDNVVNHATQTSGGTKMPRTSWKDLASFIIARPPVDLIEAFHREWMPLMELMVAMIHENRKLDELRDALLPKLITGAVPVHLPTVAE